MLTVFLIGALGWAEPAGPPGRATARPAPTVPVRQPAPRPASRPARPMILFFESGQCRWCAAMKANTLPQVELPGHDFRVVSLDGGRNAELSARYGITGLPAYVLLDGRGRLVRQGVGYLDAEAFGRWLRGTGVDGTSP
jgi:thioredoxin-related protein